MIKLNKILQEIELDDTKSIKNRIWEWWKECDIDDPEFEIWLKKYLNKFHTSKDFTILNIKEIWGKSLINNGDDYGADWEAFPATSYWILTGEWKDEGFDFSSLGNEFDY